MFSRAIALGACALFVAFAAVQLSRPLMYDDANFALAARAVADTGLPYGNQGWMSDRGDFSHREQWALWHPPLYVYLAGLFAKLGGWTPPVLRLLGLIGGTATALLTWRIAQDFTRGPPLVKDVAAALAVGATLLCPLVIQSALVLDIDFPLLLPLTLLFLWLYPRLESARHRWLWLTPLFALLLWAKMTNPLPLIGVIGVWQALRGRFKRALVHTVAIGGGGIALAGSAWLLIGSALGFPLDMPFGVNAVQWQDSAEVARRAFTSPGAFIEGFQTPVLWIGPGLVGLGLVGIGLRVGQLATCWRMRRVDLLIGFCILLALGYVNKSAGWFPKYQVALVPLLACIGAPVVAHLWCLRPRLTLLVGGVAAVASGTLTLALVRDEWALQRTFSIRPEAGAWLVAGLFGCALVGLALRAPSVAPMAGLAALAVGWPLAVDATQVQAQYQTDYWYGTTGTAEAADWVSAHLQPTQTYVSAKEVAIRSSAERYVDEDNLVYSLSLGRPLESSWMGEPLAALVIWQREPYIAELFDRAIQNSAFHEEARFGDYVIYVPLR
jgi:4-amino-4-deoxy-L-arabinose transferase-like glycosyltransferase